MFAKELYSFLSHSTVPIILESEYSPVTVIDNFFTSKSICILFMKD